MSEPTQPTPEQCSAHERIEIDGAVGWACWYPQMGGYVGRAVVVPDEGGCHKVYVWHDGDFPFSGDDPYRETTNPRELHHCDGSQFIAFGELLLSIERHGQP